MRVDIHDFGPVAQIMTGELSQMEDCCVAYEDLVDLILANRSPGSEGYEDYMVDILCDERDLNVHDRQLVRQAYYRLLPIVNQQFPVSQGFWLCCGFVQKLGYFIHSPVYDELAMGNMRLSVLSSIRSLWGFYDSSLKQRSGLY